MADSKDGSRTVKFCWEDEDIERLIDLCEVIQGSFRT